MIGAGTAITISVAGDLSAGDYKRYPRGANSGPRLVLCRCVIPMPYSGWMRFYSGTSAVAPASLTLVQEIYLPATSFIMPIGFEIVGLPYAPIFAVATLDAAAPADMPISINGEYYVENN